MIVILRACDFFAKLAVFSLESSLVTVSIGCLRGIYSQALSEAEESTVCDAKRPVPPTLARSAFLS